MDNSPQFTTWRDNAGNIAIQCLVCTRTHWNYNQPATDPLRGQPCLNCQKIKEEDLLGIENGRHQKLHLDEDGQKICDHPLSQPMQ